ncbi:MAG: phenylalanine--tRNA ligase subunit beta [Phycisphaerales bacterium]
MKASVRWLNSLLDPGDLSADQVEHTLTHVGFPIDARETVSTREGPDTQLEVEITSNRGDALSHIGLAREIAAATGQTLKLPALKEPRTQGRVSDFVALDNQAPEDCPRFTLQVIRGARIAPSPPWLAAALESVGQRPINNVVDATNYLNFLFGQPCHAFDLGKLGRSALRADTPGATGVPPSARPCVIIRRARPGEPLTTLDGKQRKLAGDEIVVADAERAQSLAGVIGGHDSEVTPATTDLALEAATWDPPAIRRAARRHQVRTDASHRFERTVDPRTLDAPAQHLLTLIADLTGGTPAAGMLDAYPTVPPSSSASSSAPSAPLRETPLRLARIPIILGIPIPEPEVARLLHALHIESRRDTTAAAQFGPVLVCTIPAHRPDLEREIDLIEELARIKGLDAIPAHARTAIAIRPAQPHERAARILGETLAALGFHETVTVSFLTDAQAALFLHPGLSLLHVHDPRARGSGTGVPPVSGRAHESALRPSLIPSLLLTRKHNQDRGATTPGGLRLFETAATYAGEDDAGRSALRADMAPPSARSADLPPEALERRTLALLLDIPGATKGKQSSPESRQQAIRQLRGALESVAHALGGPTATLDLKPAPLADPAPSPSPSSAKSLSPYDPFTHAHILLRGRHIGRLAQTSAAAQKLFDLDTPVLTAELELEPLLALYPPPPAAASERDLPHFPGIERDLSLFLDDATPWSAVRSLVESAQLPLLDSLDFVTTYRGQQTGPNKKSLTLRLTFRDPARTLRREEVDPQVARVVLLAGEQLGATLRG